MILCVFRFRKAPTTSQGRSRLTPYSGGKGHDLFTGNDGNDIFDFNSIFDHLKGAGKRDMITNFSVGDNVAGGLDDDLIDFKTIDANSLRAGNEHFQFVDKFHHKAGELDVKAAPPQHDDCARRYRREWQGRLPDEAAGLHTLTAADFVF